MEKSDPNKILDMGFDSNILSKEMSNENDNSRSDSDSRDSVSSLSTDSSDSESEYVCTVCDKSFSGYIPLKQHEKGSKHKKAVARKKNERKLLDKDSDDDLESTEHYIQEPFAACKTCDKQFSDPKSYSLHLKSKTHKKKVLQTAILEQVRENGEINVDKLKEFYKRKTSSPSSVAEGPQQDGTKEALSSSKMQGEGYDEVDSEEFECKDCEKAFTGLIPFSQHLTSKTHEKQVERKKLLHKIVPEPSTSDKASDQPNTSDVSTLSVEDDILVCKACSTSFSGPKGAMMHLKSQKHKKNLDKYLRKIEKRKKKSLAKSKKSNPESDSEESQGHLEDKQEDETPEGKSEPTATSLDNPRASESSDSANEADISTSGENAMQENYELYKSAMHSCKQDHGDLK